MGVTLVALSLWYYRYCSYAKTTKEKDNSTQYEIRRNTVQDLGTTGWATQVETPPNLSGPQVDELGTTEESTSSSTSIGSTASTLMPGPGLSGTEARTDTIFRLVPSVPRSSLRASATPGLVTVPEPVLEPKELQLLIEMNEPNALLPHALPTVAVHFALHRRSRSGPTERYQTCTYELNSNLYNSADYAVTVTLTETADVNWSSANLHRLQTGLGRLATDDQHQRCTALSVQLPTTGEISSADNPPAGSFLLPAVTKLTWQSHRNQLSLMVDATHTPRLTHLTLHCDISMEDCKRLLQIFAPTVKAIELHRIVDTNNNVLASNPLGHTQVEMVNLRSLVLETSPYTLNPGWMLNDFAFPILKVYKLNKMEEQPPPLASGVYQTIDWVAIRQTNMLEYITRDSQFPTSPN
ncbi:hypothetical protein H2248_005431 [Termitomyces sp. 'cryptogamus']|nr:hypothetical protein H2248_005431 [Termitomyces sp. 'cryptogamus']